MKLFLFLLLPFAFALSAKATDYYVSASGNDANNGTSTSTPWRTLDKVNSYFSSLQPGDRILLNRGDVFYGSITVTKSGTSGAPITIGAYGSGAKPVITGFTTVTSWNNLGGNIWESTNAVSTLPYTNMVVVNGVNTAMGRWPNSGMLYYQSHSGQNQITSNGLNGSTNWTGAELALYVTTFTVGRNVITAQSGGTLTFDNSSISYPSIQYDNQGFIIQNDPRTLDTLNEWYYNPSTHKIRIYSYGSPQGVQVATIQQLISLEGDWQGVNNVILDNISFKGSNASAILVKNSKYITVQNCDINFSGEDAIKGPWWGNSTGLKVEGCLISNINNTAIDLSGDFDNAGIRNNTIKNSGVMLGMGSKGSDNGTGTYSAILTFGSNTTIEYNNIDGAGYIGIRFLGNNISVNNNYLQNFNQLLNDGGGIYTSNNGGSSNSGNKIRNNIVLNSPHNSGIYLDANVNGLEISGNTVANCSYGIYLNNSWNVNVFGNTTYNNGPQNDGSGLLFINYESDIATRDVSINNNIFFGKALRQNTIYFRLINGIIPSTLYADNNYYVRPIDDDKTIFTSFDAAYAYKSLSEWQALSGRDGNSKKSPKTVTDVNDLRFEYNPTTSNISINLGATYIDVKNVSYNGSITLAPYTSVVLIKNGSATNQPPTAQAGNNQTITLPTSAVTLNGSGVDSDGSISAYTWTQTSGPSSATITSPISASTTVTSLVQGTYQFQLMVTDNLGATGIATVQIIVNPAISNNLVAYAGSDQVVSLPTNTVSLTGSGSVSDGTISSFNWTQTSGPSGSTITNANSVTTTVTGLVQGIYQFQLKVTDNNGATATSSIQVSVNSAGNLLPAVNPSNTVNGLDYKYYEASSYSLLPAFNTLTPVKTGTVSTFDISPANRNTAYSFNFTGYIDVPADGQYTFYTNSDDGSNLYIDGVLVVNNDGQHGPQEMSGTIGLQAGKHALSVGYFQQGGGTVLSVSYSGPGISKQVIPTSALYRVSVNNLLPAVNPSNTVNGLDYKYYEASSYSLLPAFNTLTPVKTGTVSTFDISPANRNTAYSFNFTGYIDVPADGQYTFYTNSDDGSNLYIDGILVVNNDGQHGPLEASATVGLQAGKHAISVGYFQQGGGTVLSASYSGPGISKQVIPTSALYRVSANNLLPAVNPSNTVNGLDYKYYEASSYSLLPAFNTLTPVKTGTISTFDISLANRNTAYSFNFTGYIDVPADGQYTFYTNSDDGSNLYIDGVLLVNNDGQHGPLEASATVGLQAGKHAISVGYFQQGGGTVLSVSYSGPGVSKQIVPQSSLYRVSNGSRVSNGQLSTVPSMAITRDSITPILFSGVNIKAYPNPFMNSIVVSINGDAGKYQLILIDASGRTLWNENGIKSMGTYNLTINTSSFQRGVYFLKVIQNNKSSVIKLEK